MHDIPTYSVYTTHILYTCTIGMYYSSIHPVPQLPPIVVTIVTIVTVPILHHSLHHKLKATGECYLHLC